MDKVTCKLQREAERIAARHKAPEFYVRFKAHKALALRLYYHDPMVVLLREMVRPLLQEDLGHGLFHSARVSLDSATLIYVELEPTRIDRSRIERQMVLGLLSGLLHDICRDQENHAEAGAVQAAEVLKGLSLSEEERHGICQAIRNHEAFVSPTPCGRPWLQLISDCLYDADKFRWGSDNFTHTLWHMVSNKGISPQQLIGRFPWGMSGILKILDTFRTATGRQYGPEIIETGIEIGKEMYRYLLKHYGDNHQD